MEAADADGPFDAVDAGDLDPGSKAEGVRKTGCTGTANILLGDYVHRGWRPGGGDRSLGNSCDLNVAQLFQRQAL